MEIDQLKKWRRELHSFPELGWTEFVTTSVLVRELKSMGYEPLLGESIINREFVRGRKIDLVQKAIKVAIDKGVDKELLNKMNELTGCVAIFDSGLPGPTVALRFDIDCVGVQETDNENHLPLINGFKSNTPNQMHACGHDGHMAIGLGIAKWLKQQPVNSLCGRVKLLFQPAEEGVRGAKPMEMSGIVDDCNYYLASHIGFIAKSGEIVVNPNSFLCTTKYDFRFKGLSSHPGKDPHVGINALAGCCNAATQLLAIPRHGKGMSRINVGVIRAGEARNVIPAYGELQVEVRGETEEINTFMCQQAERLVKGVALGFGLDLEIEVMGEAVDLTNDQEMVQLLSDVSKPYNLTIIESRPFGGSEDATILARRVQKINNGKAIYFVLGSDLKGTHHQSDFDFDESILPIGVNIYTNCLLKLISKK
ncbi:hypothetical protein RB653_005754 [Dictyostelium firmibasis]|uniref:Peptidase M20 dimerisation domain-containing protein n=1 Tax=Dictyostelium firmibasis TaxID=79012 RepID=A0AAN7U8J3_9MYCE